MRTLRETCRRGATLALLATGLAVCGGPAIATQMPALQTQAAAAPQAAGPVTVFRCVGPAGAVQFSDSPCPSGTQGTAWNRPAHQPGIAPAGKARPGPAAHALLAPPAAPALAGPAEPWVDCRQRGGSFDAASRVCKLPADTVEHMFRAD
jgi:hypothetical protein